MSVKSQAYKLSGSELIGWPQRRLSGESRFHNGGPPNSEQSSLIDNPGCVC